MFTPHARPEGYSDLPQVVPDTGPQVVPDTGPQVLVVDNDNEKIPAVTVHDSKAWYTFGLAKRTIWIGIAVLLVAVAVGLGAGLGVGLRKKPATQTPTVNSQTTQAATSSSASTLASTLTSSQPPTLTTSTIPLPSVTLLRDCPSSNNTLHAIDSPSNSPSKDTTPLLFRKTCSSGLRHILNGQDVLNRGPIASLDDCIQQCVDYNFANRTAIAAGQNQTCNAVCWRNDKDVSSPVQLPGQCFGFTARNTTAGVEITDELLCDSAFWVNERNL
ncbi:hypothetical protein DM02DRAFT_612987 [Periconia macrospinosa]|uniref:Apple domain-containing protein n=1 Tax=Periconia macrospinosa TaxID=97972 RepID=A0A2V1DVQ8_9PLEO|nr:hypothetical protein DM02DRAFT_612987 [Periconia macrospinosa]